MSDKKLIIFIPTIEDGGVEKNLFIVTNYLKDRINKISIITSSWKFKNKFNKKIKFISFRANFLEKIGRRKKFIICLYLLFLQILKDKNLVVLSFQGNFYSIILCKLFGIKIIVRSNTAPEGWSKNPLKNYLFKRILPLADKVIVNSIDFKNKLKSKFKINAICIYNPLNKEEIIKKAKIKANYIFNKKKINIINVGRIVDQKDQLTLLKAVNLIKKKVNFNLLIVGKGEKKNNLLEFINKNNLSDNIQLIDYKKNPYNLIKLSDIFVLTSKYEGLPNVLLEAQALKTCIISTNCPTGPREILLNGEAGTLIDTGNYQKLSNILIDFSKNQKIFKKKAKIGYKKLYRFDYKKNLKRYYYEVISLF